MHGNRFEPDFKGFCKTFLPWDRQLFVFTEFDTRFDGWYFTIFIIFESVEVSLCWYHLDCRSLQNAHKTAIVFWWLSPLCKAMDRSINSLPTLWSWILHCNINGENKAEQKQLVWLFPGKYWLNENYVSPKSSCIYKLFKTVGRFRLYPCAANG